VHPGRVVKLLAWTIKVELVGVSQGGGVECLADELAPGDALLFVEVVKESWRIETAQWAGERDARYPARSRDSHRPR